MKDLVLLFTIILLISSSLQSQDCCVDDSLIDPFGICILIFDPVCGCDGVQYDNSCLAEKLGGIALDKLQPGFDWTMTSCTDAWYTPPAGCPGASDCPDLGGNIGEACEDIDNCLTGGTIEDGCTCSGLTFLDDDNDAVCDNDVADDCIGPNVGDACPDNDCYINNTVNADCECVGTLIDDDIDMICDADVLDNCFGPNIDDACDDDDVLTINDTVDANCVCAGTPDPDYCFNLSFYIGEDCDDSDPLTINDVVTSDCACVGTPDPNYCFDWNGYIGDTCDDGFVTTTDDLITADCECVGIPDPSYCVALGLYIGDECDDENENTLNDVISEDCLCEGTPNPDYCLDLDLFIGELCDDDNEDTVNDAVNEECECEGEIFVPGTATSVVAWLQGYDNGDGTMKTDLADNGLLSMTQPYFDEPYEYTGGEEITSFPANTVDWVLLQLRDSEDPSIVVLQQAMFLRNDGYIMTLDGSIELSWANFDTGSYYVVVIHANHLNVISNETIDMAAGITFDFTNGIGQAMGTDQQIATGAKAGLFAGDFDGNGIINVTDFNLWIANPAGVNVYSPIDADGNGFINVSDFNFWFTNRSKVGNTLIQL